MLQSGQGGAALRPLPGLQHMGRRCDRTGGEGRVEQLCERHPLTPRPAVRAMSKMKQTEADLGVTAKALENSGERLSEFVATLERVQEAVAVQKAIAKECLAKAKSEGFDPKAVIQALKRKDEGEQDRQSRMDFEAVVSTYIAALGAADAEG
jgi:uncharacterized protein (UPF0335 family)